jgi:hypothetical protein
MIIETYMFKGENGSLGYRTGHYYDLDVGPYGKSSIRISPQNKSFMNESACVYESENSFNRNWKKVTRVFNEMDPYGEEMWDD